MEKILFIGPPGAGKSTQSCLLKMCGFQHINAEELIRETTNPEILKYSENTEKNLLLSDELIFNLIEESIKEENYILDGLIKTIPQAKYIEKKGLAEKVFYFNVPQKVCRRRLRNEIGNKSNESSKAIKKRFKTYENELLLTKEYFKKNFKFYEINGNQQPTQVHQEIINYINVC